jgi:hypothetical protein
MSRSLRARLDRLEKRRREAGSDMLPPHFWEAICGMFPIEELDPDTRRLVEPLFKDGCDEPDPNQQSEGATTS